MRQGSSIFYGTLLLTGANLLLRLVFMAFQVYLSGQIGAAGIGLLQLVLSVRFLASTLGSAGTRTCAMYLTGEALGRQKGVRPVLTGCVHYGLACSTAAAVILWLGAPYLAERWIGNLSATHALRLYAIFLPVVCLSGVMTGCFTAAGRIRTLVSAEFLEQGWAMAVTVFLLTRWAGPDLAGNPGRACFSVAMGSCTAALFTLCVLVLLWRDGGPTDGPPPYGRILRMTLPLAVSENLRAGLNTVENLIIPLRLGLFAGTTNALADYGILHGMVFPLMMAPAAVLFSLADLLVPEFSRCAGRPGQVRVRYLARRGLRAALLFSLCAGGLLWLKSQALGECLYHSDAAGAALRLYAPLAAILYLDAVVDAMCKGLGQQQANARYNLLTSLLDVALLWVLLPRFGMGGYYFSFTATHLMNFILSLRRLGLAAGVRFSLGLPLRASFSAGAAAALAGALPEQAGIAGMLAPAARYLLLLGLLWPLCRVAGRQDLLWLQGLAGRKTPPSP